MGLPKTLLSVSSAGLVSSEGKELMKHREQIEYLVGQEHDLPDLLRSPEVRGLLREALGAGAAQLLIRLEDGSTACSEGVLNGAAPLREISIPLFLEGERVGHLLVRG